VKGKVISVSEAQEKFIGKKVYVECLQGPKDIGICVVVKYEPGKFNGLISDDGRAYNITHSYYKLHEWVEDSAIKKYGTPELLQMAQDYDYSVPYELRPVYTSTENVIVTFEQSALSGLKGLVHKISRCWMPAINVEWTELVEASEECDFQRAMSGNNYVRFNDWGKYLTRSEALAMVALANKARMNEFVNGKWFFKKVERG
jgi:hypothetical protein